MENKVYFRVGEKEITSNDVDQFIKQLGQDGFRFNSDEGRTQLAHELLNQELLLLDAKESKLDESKEYLDELNLVKEQILKQHSMRRVLNSVEVSDDEAKEFYNTHPEYFNEVHDFHASHILVGNEDEAIEIKAKLDSGEDFKELAQANSTCPSKDRGGDLGHFQSGQMVPEFEKALHELGEGEVSDVVKTQFGYHIIKLAHKHIVRENTFESFKDDIKNQLLNQKQQEAYLSKTEELKTKYNVESL